jgi:hypothetical protein
MRVHAERFTVALAAAALAIGLLGAVSATSGGDPQSREKERREKEITVVAREKERREKEFTVVVAREKERREKEFTVVAREKERREKEITVAV